MARSAELRAEASAMAAIEAAKAKADALPEGARKRVLAFGAEHFGESLTAQPAES